MNGIESSSSGTRRAPNIPRSIHPTGLRGAGSPGTGRNRGDVWRAANDVWRAESARQSARLSPPLARRESRDARRDLRRAIGGDGGRPPGHPQSGWSISAARPRIPERAALLHAGRRDGARGRHRPTISRPPAPARSRGHLPLDLEAAPRRLARDESAAESDWTEPRLHHLHLGVDRPVQGRRRRAPLRVAARAEHGLYRARAHRPCRPGSKRRLRRRHVRDLGSAAARRAGRLRHALCQPGPARARPADPGAGDHDDFPHDSAVQSGRAGDAGGLLHRADRSVRRRGGRAGLGSEESSRAERPNGSCTSMARPRRRPSHHGISSRAYRKA